MGVKRPINQNYRREHYPAPSDTAIIEGMFCVMNKSTGEIRRVIPAGGFVRGYWTNTGQQRIVAYIPKDA